MISTRAHRSSDLLRKRALPGGYFTRAIYRGGRNHVGPANVLVLAFASGWFVHCTNHRQAAVTSCDSRLQVPDLSLMHRTFSANRIAPKHPLRSRAANSSRFRPRHNLISPCLILTRRFRYNTHIPRGEW